VATYHFAALFNTWRHLADGKLLDGNLLDAGLLEASLIKQKVEMKRGCSMLCHLCISS
jgi:hypothetical protein